MLVQPVFFCLLFVQICTGCSLGVCSFPMASRSVIVFLALAFVGAPVSGQSLLSLLPPQLQSLLPSSAIPPLSQVTPRDVQVAQAIGQKLPTFSSIQQLLQTLSLNSPTLAALTDQAVAKGKQLFDLTKSMLTPESQLFFQQLLGIGQSAGQQSVQLLQAQTPPTLANLQSTFPTISSLVQSPIAQQSVNLLYPS
uniref:Obesity factor n=1 Tax=Bursaphelenchus xylophilus TaxID=6326 RepID=A0A1I7RNM3_BURXY